MTTFAADGPPGHEPAATTTGHAAAVWTPQAIERFWRFHSRHAHEKGICFSHMLGSGLCNFLLASGALRPGTRVLDFGCGPGYLLQEMLATGATCWGVDLSAEAVAAAEQRLSGRPGWQQAMTRDQTAQRLEAGSFDLITCVETLEHLHDDDLDRLLVEVRDLLAVGGTALFTTPNEEDLEAAQVFCPFCSTAFHPMQHMRTFSSTSLAQELIDHGFEVMLCTATNLGWFQLRLPRSPLQWSLADLGSRARRLLCRLLDRLSGRPFATSHEYRRWFGRGPHLVALAVRPASGAAEAMSPMPDLRSVR